MKLLVFCLAMLSGMWSPQLRAQVYTWLTVAGDPWVWGSADGTNRDATFYTPLGIAADSSGVIYVSDTGNMTIRKVTPIGADWVVTTIAGLAGAEGSVDAIGPEARFRAPRGIAVAPGGDLFVVDNDDATIRRLRQIGTNWMVTTIAGLSGATGSADGIGPAARFANPYGIAIGPDGALYVADLGNQTIRKVTEVGSNSWNVVTFAGLARVAGTENGTRHEARFWNPQGIAVDGSNNVYVAEGNTLRRITQDTAEGTVSTIAGRLDAGLTIDGPGSEALFALPTGVAVDETGTLFVSQYATIRKVTPVTNGWFVTTIGGRADSPGRSDGTNSAARFGEPAGVALDGAGRLYVVDLQNWVVRMGVPDMQPTNDLPPIANCENAFVWADTNGVAHVPVGDNSFDPDGDPITITRSPPGPYPIGTNIITVTVTDSHGASDTCHSYLVVQDPTPPEISPVGGEPQFTMSGRPGQIIVLQSSVDCVNWASIATNTYVDRPLLLANDLDATNGTHHFYRLKLWP